MASQVVPQSLSFSEAEEIDRLYRLLSRRLEQIVRRDVRAPAPLIEDACQTAWGQLIAHPARVRRETALAWLAATAAHEAFRLLRRGRRELALESAGGPADASAGPRVSSPADALEHRERIAGMAALPARQQRLVWLQALGFTYAEMAAHERCTRRTVERHLLRARAELRARSI